MHPFFGSAYHRPWRGLTNLVFEPTCLPSMRVNFEEVERGIKEAPNNPKYGPDLIPLYFIKWYDTSFIKHLVVHFNKSLKSGIYPNAWKFAFIQPILKKGNKELVINYIGLFQFY